MLLASGHGFSLRGFVLFVGDIIAVIASITLAAMLRLGIEGGQEYIQTNELALTISVVTYVLVFYIGGLYERRTLTQKQNVFLPSLLSVLAGLVLIIVMFYAQYELLIGRGVLFLSAFFTFVSVWSFRHFYRMVAGYGLFQKNALVVGDGRDAARILRLLEEIEDPGFRIYGLVAHNKNKVGEFISTVPVLGHIDRLREFVAHYRVETLIVATSLSKEPSLLKILRPLRYAGVEILDFVSFNEEIAQRIPLDHIDDEWLMHAAMNSSRIHIRNLKRIMDVTVAVVGLLLSLPISLLTMILIKLDSAGPIFFTQLRSGLDGQPYTVFKFRTMRMDAEHGSGAKWATKHDTRITRVGRFLRKSRIDEIPQLANVLRGEMSLVGPRPERPEFVESLTQVIPFYKERLLVPPGITGWAQVHYPYAASIQASRQKLQYDLYYIKHMSLVLDILILLRTFKTILVGLRYSEDEEEPSERKGNPSLTVLSARDGASSETKTA